MKRKLLVLSVIILMGTFAFGISVQNSIAAEKSKYGGILRINHAKQAGIIGDPLEIRGWNRAYIHHVLQVLIRPDMERFGEYYPHLATSWDIATDRSHIIFKLRKGVKFHDGTDFNAQALKWNINRFLDSPSPKYSNVTSVDVVDDHTIRANTSLWDATVMNDFGIDTYIISPTAFEKNGQAWARYNPVGTGAFKAVEMRRKIVLKTAKFADYWEEGLPYLDRVDMYMISDPMTASASMKRGEIDAMVEADSITAEQFSKTGGFEVITSPFGAWLLYFNSEDPNSVWSNQKMREALEYAVDKEMLSKVVFRGYASPTYEIIQYINKSTGGKPGTIPRKLNPEKARQLVKEAGLSEGLKVKIAYLSVSPLMRDIFLVLQTNLKKVGIEVVPNPMTPASFQQKLTEPLPPNELSFVGLGGGGEAISLDILRDTFHSDSVRYRGVKRPEGATGQLNKAFQALDKDEQLNILSDLERKAYGMAMFMPIFATNTIVIQNPKVKDAIWFDIGKSTPNLRRAWLSKE